MTGRGAGDAVAAGRVDGVKVPRFSLEIVMRGPRIAGATFLAAMLGCSSTGPTSIDIAARGRWAQRAPASYRITVSRSCECLREMSGPTVVTVENGVITSRRYVSGETVPAEYADLFPAVDGLFGIIDEARKRGAARLDVTYDPTFGFPAIIAIDYDRVMADDEVTWQAADLQLP